jgi:hypothetical protein
LVPAATVIVTNAHPVWPGQTAVYPNLAKLGEEGAAATQRPTAWWALGLRISLTLDSQPSGTLAGMAGATLGRDAAGRRSPLSARSTDWLSSVLGRAVAISTTSRQAMNESVAAATPATLIRYRD